MVILLHENESALADKKFIVTVARWLEGPPTRAKRIWWWLRAAYYQSFWRMNFRWRPVLRTGVVAVTPASAPIFAHLFRYPEIDLETALQWTLAIFCLALFSAALRKLLTPHVKDTLAEEMLLRLGEAVVSVRNGAMPAADKHAARSACLSIIEVYVRAVTGAQQGEIGVSLVTYVGNSTHELRIDERNKGNRRATGRKFNGKFNLGHHACLAGSDPRAVYDLKEFGPNACKSPTGSKVRYRSLFIVPLMNEIDGKLRPIGYISIDSVCPFEFYGNRANVIAVELGNIAAYLKKLL